MRAAEAFADTGEVTITVEAGDWADLVPDFDRRIPLTIAAALEAACPGVEPAGIAVILTDDRAIQDLNRLWRDQDKPTNVLSFPTTDVAEGDRPVPTVPGMPLELGDIVLAFETCRREAGPEPSAFARHLDHLVVHGVLHLLGYDHVLDDAAERMEDLERQVMASLGHPDPYAA
jgi:probable rRNA maturation factor